MTKLKNPLLALSAIGRLGNAITFRRRGRQIIAETIAQPIDAKSETQLGWRHMYLKAVALWHALSPEEKQEWESLARRRHMTGFAWFISQCLRPNPGIYLPLQGGTMSGDIVMAGHRILVLPAPTADQEAATKKYVDDSIIPNYTAGARVYRFNAQDILDNTYTYISWEAYRYGTGIHYDPTDIPTVFTIITPGVYYVSATFRWASNAAGFRTAHIMKNRSVPIVESAAPGHATMPGSVSLSTSYKFAFDDEVELLVYQNSGGHLNIWPIAEHSPEFTIQRIG